MHIMYITCVFTHMYLVLDIRYDSTYIYVDIYCIYLLTSTPPPNGIV